MENDRAVLSSIEALAGANKEIDVLWLYGSQADGSATVSSDWDIAIAFANEEPALAPMQETRVDALAHKWSVMLEAKLSVVDINKAPTPLAYSVVQEGKVVHCTNPLRLHAEEQRIWSKWEEYCREYEQKTAS